MPYNLVFIGCPSLRIIEVPSRFQKVQRKILVTNFLVQSYALPKYPKWFQNSSQLQNILFAIILPISVYNFSILYKVLLNISFW